jgi:hypothetical protein
MRLLTETYCETNILTESTEGGKKNYFIEGVFLQADVKNRNNRYYPKSILMNEVARYNNEYVQPKRAMGELGHPTTGPSINLDRVSHLITSLRPEGNNVIGKAKLIDSPTGKIAKNLIDEGVKFGVSSRGVGSLEQCESYSKVCDDFMMSAIDIVADPSAPNAFVSGLMEDREWIYENGIWKTSELEIAKKQIKKTSVKEIDEAVLSIFKQFMDKVSIKK